MIPCKDCITLGMCKAQSMFSSILPYRYEDVIEDLINKCSIIKEYIEYNSEACRVDAFKGDQVYRFITTGILFEKLDVVDFHKMVTPILV